MEMILLAHQVILVVVDIVHTEVVKKYPKKMRHLRKYENFKLESKSKEIGEIKFPDFRGDKIYMLEFDLENPILPDKYKRWESVVSKMIENSPIKSGKAYLTVDEDKVSPGKTHRRGGVHVDGNFIYGFKDGKVIEIETTNEDVSWGSDDSDKSVSWGSDDSDKSVSWGKEDSKKDRVVSWGKTQTKTGTSWSNMSDPTPSSWATGFLVGGLNEEQHFKQYCSSGNGGMIISSSYEACDGWIGEFDNIPLDGGDCSHIDLSGLDKFRLKANKVYLGNSTFLHESLPIDEEVNRQMIRITLPNQSINI
jgi:hypothetical protein